MISVACWVAASVRASRIVPYQVSRLAPMTTTDTSVAAMGILMRRSSDGRRAKIDAHNFFMTVTHAARGRRGLRAEEWLSSAAAQPVASQIPVMHAGAVDCFVDAAVS